jgi:hypothetical protein
MKTTAAILTLLALAAAAAATRAAPPLPATLRDTGFERVGKTAFEPQYPLWTDGASKRRWIHLPAGASVDASQPDAFAFPPGTRIWKEFGYERPVETRFIERLPDGAWRYATYVWNAEGTEATLAPEDGQLVIQDRAPVIPAKAGIQFRYAIPSRADCLACHEGPAVPVLGFTALQLSPALRELVERGLVRNLPRRLLEEPPRIAGSSATERAALGYLHGNCGHCHNAYALPGAGLELLHGSAHPAQSAQRASASLAGREGEILRRIASRNPMVRMPPLGTAIHDEEGISLVERWLRNPLQRPEERSR